MAKCILVGYQLKDYFSKASNRQVQGYNLHLVGPAALASTDAQALKGSEVFTEFVRPDIVQGVQLAVGNAYDVEYGRGFNGKASVAAVHPLIEATPAPLRSVSGDK